MIANSRHTGMVLANNFSPILGVTTGIFKHLAEKYKNDIEGFTGIFTEEHQGWKDGPSGTGGQWFNYLKEMGFDLIPMWSDREDFGRIFAKIRSPSQVCDKTSLNGPEIYCWYWQYLC